MPKVKVYGKTVRVSKAKAKAIRTAQRANKTALYNPSAILSGESLRSAAHQVTNATVNPQIQALDRQAANTQAQGLAAQNKAGDYYAALAREAQSSLDRSKAINATALQGVQQAGDVAQQRLSSAASVNAEAVGQDVALRGSGLQAGNRAAEEIAAARANAASSSQTAQTSAALLGGVSENYQNNLGGVTALRGAETYSQLGNAMNSRLADIRGKKQDVQSQTAGLYSQNLLNLRNQQFENAVVQQGILGDQQKLATDLAETRSNNRTKLKLQRAATRDKLRLQNDAQKAAAKLKAGFELTAKDKKAIETQKIAKTVNGNKSLSPSEKRQRRNDLNKAATTLSNAIGQAQKIKSTGKARHAGAALLLAGQQKQSVKDPKTGETLTIPEIKAQDQLMASIALDMAYDGHISKRNLALARKRYPGLVKSLGLNTKAPAKAKGNTGIFGQVNSILGIR